MRKRDLIKAARKEFPDVDKMVNAILKAINTALVNKESVRIINFGTFEVKECPVREVHDFKTGKRVRFGGKLTIKFKASKAVERILNERNLTKGNRTPKSK